MQTQDEKRTKSLARLALTTFGLIAVAFGGLGIISPHSASAAQTTWKAIPMSHLSYREKWLVTEYEILIHNDGSKPVKSMTVVVVYNTGPWGAGRTTQSFTMGYLSSSADTVVPVGSYKELISVDVEDLVIEK